MVGSSFYSIVGMFRGSVWLRGCGWVGANGLTGFCHE